MLNGNFITTRQLAAIDKVYSRFSKYASISERIKYCSNLLQRTENFLTENKTLATEHILKTSMEIIIATREEINSLSIQKN